jgi:putative membrane protein
MKTREIPMSGKFFHRSEFFFLCCIVVLLPVISGSGIFGCKRPDNSKPLDTPIHPRAHIPQILQVSRSEHTITLEDNTMSSVIEDIKDNPEIYDGKKIVFPGQVIFHEKGRHASFAITRMRMICCAADLQPIGFKCSFSHSSDLREKSWKKVFGILRVEKNGKENEPFIDVVRVMPMQKPDQEYIYPRILN